jgi:P-type Cu+ transporter
MTTESAQLPKSYSIQKQCFHCHDSFKGTYISYDNKGFCCEGCKTVYQILNENNLCTYYSLDANAGINQTGRAPQYLYLDDAETATKILDFQDDTVSKVTFYIPAMHCASCIWLLENLYKINKGVFNSKVNFLKKEVVILFSNKETTLREVAETLAQIGYAPEVNLYDVDKDKKPSIDRSIYYKLGLAGFAFGNIMLLSFPEYLGINESLDKTYAPYLAYISLILATPVLLYSAKDYLVSAWNGLKNGHLNIDVPLSLGIVALYFRSAFEILTQTGAGYMDSFSGLIFLLLTGKWFQQKTFNHLSFERDYKSYFPVAAHVKKEGGEVATPLSKLSVNDIIIVRNEELIPADGILLRGKARIDYSFVTGEAEPVSKQSGDTVFAGGKQMGEAIEINLTRKVSQSYLTELWNNDAFKNEAKSHISHLADQAGKYFTFVIMIVSIGSFLYWFQQDMSKAINAATAVLIVACPCAVALAIPYTLGNILRILGRNEFYLKNTNVIENFERVDAVVFDKTGTITERLKNEIHFVGHLETDEKAMIKSLVLHSNHPLSILIKEHLQEAPLPSPQRGETGDNFPPFGGRKGGFDISDFEEIVGKGIQGFVNQHFIKIGSSEFLTESLNRGVFGNGVFVAINGVVKGYFDIKPHYREGFEMVLESFSAMKKDVYILSGDNDKERDFLKFYIKENHLFFNQKPLDKLNFIKNLQENKQKVMMIGDGLNDAGALQQANIGVVISENTNNFSPACDAILRADKFNQLPSFLTLAKGGSTIVNRAYVIAFSYNFFGLTYAVMGNLSPLLAAILMPLSSVTIVVFGVLAGNVLRKKLKIE